MQMIEVTLNEMVQQDPNDPESIGLAVLTFSGAQWKMTTSSGWLALEERKGIAGNRPERLLFPEHRVLQVSVREHEAESAVSEYEQERAEQEAAAREAEAGEPEAEAEGEPEAGGAPEEAEGDPSSGDPGLMEALEASIAAVQEGGKEAAVEAFRRTRLAEPDQEPPGVEIQ